MARSKVYGSEKIRKALDDLAREFPNAAAIAVYQEAGEIFNASQEQVPVDKGDLRQSGLLTIVRRGTGYTAMVGYGAAYALRMHEETKYDANRTQPKEGDYSATGTTGKSKYLEDPFNEALAGMDARLKKRVAMLIKAKGGSPDPTLMPDVKGSGKAGSGR